MMRACEDENPKSMRGQSCASEKGSRQMPNEIRHTYRTTALFPFLQEHGYLFVFVVGLST